jgi:hypothetical protein
VGPRAGLDDMENGKFLTLPGLEFQSLSRSARSQSQYRLSYYASNEGESKNWRGCREETRLLLLPGTEPSLCDYEVRSVVVDCLCGLGVRVLGYRSGGPGSIPGTTRKKK